MHVKLCSNSPAHEIKLEFLDLFFSDSTSFIPCDIMERLFFSSVFAFAMIQPRAKLGLLFLPIMIEARVFVPLILLSDLFFGIFRLPGDNVGRFAHLGGALFGFIILWYWKKNQFKRWY